VRDGAQLSLDRLFADAERGGEISVGPARPESVAPRVKLVASMGPEELKPFAPQFSQWACTSLGHLRERSPNDGRSSGA
jgi:hypothetical protein